MPLYEEPPPTHDLSVPDEAPPALAALTTPTQAAPPAPVAEPGVPLQLAPPPPRPPRPPAKPSARELAAKAYRAQLAPALTADVMIPEGDPIPVVDPLQLASLAAACPEVHLESPELGAVVLVATPSGLDRLELTYGQAALLTQVIATFPGARLVKLTRRVGTDAAEPKHPGRTGPPEEWCLGCGANKMVASPCMNCGAP